ncbi:MAG: DUF6056 family protein [Anaerolineaceae bacterium]|jgi:hypothetical protein|nr:DUF6056 family protein [Anaerolineaceae bacterium]
MKLSKSIVKNKKTFFVILLGGVIAALLAAIFMHACIGSFSRYLADDYCTAGELKRLGFWPAQHYWYTQWTGRFSFILLVSALEGLGTGIVPYLPGVYVVSFLLAGVFFIHQLLKKISAELPWLLSLFLAAVIVFLTLYTTPNIGQNLYWLTGSANYFVPVIAIFFLLGLVVQQDHGFADRPAMIKISLGVSIAVFSWLTSGFSEIITVIQFLVLLLVNVYQRFFHPKKRLHVLWVITFLSGLAGLVMMIASPGNAARMQAHSYDRLNIFSLLVTTVKYAGSFSILWFLKHVHLVWPVSTIIILTACIAGKYFSPSLGKKLEQDQIWFLIIALLLMVLIFASFLPTTWATANPPEKRVLIFPTVLLSLLMVYLSAAAGVFLGAALSIEDSHFKPAAIILLAFTVYFILAVPVYEARKVYFIQSEAREFAERWDQREMEISEKIKGGQTDLVVQMIPTNIMEIEHLQSDPTHWINRCTSKYYGIESISAQ